MTNEEIGNALLALARDSIGERFGLSARPLPPIDILDEPGASFVTLTQGGELRGCIGTLEARRPLAEDVHENAQAAAFLDPRFPPLARDEFERTRVEVSVLTPPEPMAFEDEADALAQLRPGIDGVILLRGRQRATFLPQVWESLPEPTRFIEHLKRKAGLPGDYWGHDVTLARYQVRKWKEA